jgi:uncharacterized membrane protein YGL010W
MKFYMKVQEKCGLLIKVAALKLPIYEVFIILKDVTITWQKWGSKQVLKKRKTSLSLMNIGWCLTFVGVYIYSQTSKRSTLGQRRNGLIKQVTS